MAYLVNGGFELTVKLLLFSRNCKKGKKKKIVKRSTNNLQVFPLNDVPQCLHYSKKLYFVDDVSTKKL